MLTTTTDTLLAAQCRLAAAIREGRDRIARETNPQELRRLRLEQESTRGQLREVEALLRGEAR